MLSWLRSHQLIDITLLQPASSDLGIEVIFDLDFNGRGDLKCISWFTFLSRLCLHRIFLFKHNNEEYLVTSVNAGTADSLRSKNIFLMRKSFCGVKSPRWSGLL